MVMAAGAGTRLRPLTFSTPKPMVPIANRPVLEYTLENLRRHGITDIILNLHSYPEAIRNHFKTGKRWGVNLRYSREPRLLGTAGGVKKTGNFLKGGTFLVMSGDGLTDIDLTGLMHFHRAHRAEATLALKPVDARFEYGVTLTDKTGRVKQFLEKPHWGDVFSNQVNTGIYVLEPSILRQIPVRKFYDFGHDLWPKLMRKKTGLFGFAMKDYWCDVGNLQEYRRAQKDILDGKLHFRFSGRSLRPGVWVDEGTILPHRIAIEPPCLIGRNCRVAPGAHLGAYTVIGDRACIGQGVSLRYCTLWNDVRVADRVTLENCVIGHGARVTENISMYEGAVINVAD